MNNKPVLTEQEKEARDCIVDSLFPKEHSVFAGDRNGARKMFELLWPMLRETWAASEAYYSYLDGPGSYAPDLNQYLTSLLTKLKETDGK